MKSYNQKIRNISLKYPGAINRFLAVAFIVLFSSSMLNAQNNNTIYFMDRLPQSSLLNPSFQPNYNFYIGLPVLSSINMNAGTNFMSFSDIIFKSSEMDSLITILHPSYNIDDFIGKLNDRNYLGPDMHVNLFRLGVRYRDMFFNLSVSERMSMRASLPKDLFVFGLKGNEEFLGRKADFSNLGVDFNYYREFALGASYPVNERLTVGGTGKLLFGMGNISIADHDISLYTDPESYNMIMSSRFTVNMSMPFDLEYDEEGNIKDIVPHFDDDDYNYSEFIFNTQNAGMAIDLGATYRFSDDITFYGSVTDLGFIKWNSNVNNISMDGEFEFEGFDIAEIINDDNDKYFDNLLDSIVDIFNFTDTQNSFTRGLGTRIYLGGTYQFNDMLKFGALSRSEIRGGNFMQAMTLSANADFTRWLSASMSYSMMNHSYNNVGMGLGIRGGPIQFYLLSDNINTLFMPHRSQNVNLWFGLNLVFGYKRDLLMAQ